MRRPLRDFRMLDEPIGRLFTQIHSLVSVVQYLRSPLLISQSTLSAEQ